MDALVAAWKALPAKVRKSIDPNGCPDEYKLSAQEFDRLRTSPDQAGVDDLNAELASQAAA
jgi:hypothetical protein